MSTDQALFWCSWSWNHYSSKLVRSDVNRPRVIIMLMFVQLLLQLLTHVALRLIRHLWRRMSCYFHHYCNIQCVIVFQKYEKAVMNTMLSVWETPLFFTCLLTEQYLCLHTNVVRKRQEGKACPQIDDRGASISLHRLGALLNSIRERRPITEDTYCGIMRRCPRYIFRFGACHLVSKFKKPCFYLPESNHEVQLDKSKCTSDSKLSCKKYTSRSIAYYTSNTVAPLERAYEIFLSMILYE